MWEKLRGAVAEEGTEHHQRAPMGGRSSKPSARADSGSWSPKGSPRTPPPASPTPAQVVPKKPKRRLIAWLTRRKRTKEVTLNKLAEDAISPEQVFAEQEARRALDNLRESYVPARVVKTLVVDSRSIDFMDK